MSDQNNTIHFDHLTATKIQFACYLMYQCMETNKHLQTLSNVVDTLPTVVNLVYSKIMDLENDVIEQGDTVFELNKGLVKVSERRLAQQEERYFPEKMVEKYENHHLEMKRHSRSRNLRL